MTLIKNKKAFFDYEILQSYEAGIELLWHEVKSIKSKNANLKWSFVIARNGELFLKSFHISPWLSLPDKKMDTDRMRKLLLKKKDIEYLSGKMKEGGYTVIVTEIYLKDHLLKARVALGKWKKTYQKKQLLKEKDLRKISDMQMKKYY